MRCLILALLAFGYSRADRACNVCQVTVAAAQTWYKVNGPVDEKVFHEQLLKECAQLAGSADTTSCKTFVNCQYRKIHGDVHHNSETAERTCIDIGSCPGPLSSSDAVKLVDWTAFTTDYNVRCVPVALLVLHHTVTHSAQETLEILQNRGLSVQYIAGKNGTMYQMVHDYYRAWHAGVSHWGNYNDLNSWAVGIEIVNTGDEPFPLAQMNGVIELARMIINRWHIEPRNIVGHFDIKTAGKMDPSGYFNWKMVYEKLGYFSGAFDSKLTPAQQKAVILKPASFTPAALTKVQQALSDWGYKGNIVVNGAYDQKTLDTIQAFNRHWCPEIFIIEKVDYKTNLTVTNPLNSQWYGISEERVHFLLNTI